jgi:hypothetical protein
MIRAWIPEELHSSCRVPHLTGISGDEDEQERQLALCDMSDAKLFWAARDKDLNTITLAARRQTSRKTMPDEKASTFSNPLQSTAVVLSAGSATVPTLFNMAALDRKAMEQERLSRLGKRRRDPSPEQEPTKFELFNPRAGHTDSWQLGESVDDFIRRLSPTTTSIATCPWIWAENPHRNPRDVSAASRVDEFTSRGMELLANSLKTRQRIQAKGSEGHKAVLNKQLKQESNDLQQRIADLAAEHHICTGKVTRPIMLVDLIELNSSDSGCCSRNRQMLLVSGSRSFRA